MAKIKLSEVGFSMIPEGHYTFKVEDATYDETFGKIEVDLITKSGRKHKERYQLINGKGKLVEGAQKAFSYFAKTALNNFDVEEIEIDDIVGTYVSANVVHHESDTINDNTGLPYVNVRLNDLTSEIGFDTDDEVEEVESDQVDDADADDLDLDDFPA